LGFTEQGGLGSQGWHEGQASVQYRKGRLPTTRWLEEFVTDVLRLHLRMPRALEFRFLGLDQEDEAAADAVTENRMKSGRLTLNEARDTAGEPRYDVPEADMPLLVTTKGVVFLDGASETAPPGTLITAGGAAPAAGEHDDKDTDENEDADGDSDGEEDDQAPDGERAEAVKTELAAFRRWARRNPAPRRPFQFGTVTKADAPDVNQEIVLFADPVQGGGERPKASSSQATDAREWPGWSVDRRAAAYWKRRVIKAMRGVVDARVLAERWIAQRGIVIKADEPDLGGVQREGGDDDHQRRPYDDAVGWLVAQGVSLTAALLIIREIQADGYVIGERSASAVLTGEWSVDWSQWRPGDPDAARLVRPTGAANGLQTLLDDAGIVIHNVAANRMDRFAKVLSDALARGDSADTLALSIGHLLADPSWAERIAVTEIARGVSAASLFTYQANGIRQKSWLTAVDERVCPVCLTNEGAGAIGISQPFPSGHQMPPGHPSCRCCPLPEGIGI
jgi:SPP1 gp7 family putative phage head morphogenesis protein